MKKILLFILIFIAYFDSNSRENHWKYKCHYCTVQAWITIGGTSYFICTNWEHELRMTDYPDNLKPGVANLAYCDEIKTYAAPLDRGNGHDSYVDTYDVPWIYLASASGSPQIHVSYSNVTLEYCIEIPVLETKFVAFDLASLGIPYLEYWEKTAHIEGTKVFMDLIDSASDTIKLSLDLQPMFELDLIKLFTISPNPFTSEIDVSIDHDFFDTSSNLKIKIKDFSGNTIAEENATSYSTSFNTSSFGSGYYLIILYKNDEFIEYRYAVK